QSDTDEVVITAEDSAAPFGQITWPSQDGLCFGGPVTVEDDFTDTCEPDALTRTYVPPGGPTYSEHGDYLVTLTVTDPTGNPAMDDVSFTIDLVAPTARMKPRPDEFIIPSTLPFTDLFEASDEDGASGGVVLEQVFLDDCLVFDGATYVEEPNGLLSDDTLEITRELLCEVVARCGLPGMDEPVVRVDAYDCGGNLGSSFRVIPVNPKLFPPACQALLTLSGDEVSWLPVFEAEAYDLGRGDVRRLAAADGIVDLGSVSCLAEDTMSTNSTDGARPQAGEAFFYLVRYRHGLTTSEYGWSSADEPERSGEEDCIP
ncbi:MAG: hypothetical protein JSV80_07685, partial [Acidobacteriota bacterium]